MNNLKILLLLVLSQLLLSCLNNHNETLILPDRYEAQSIDDVIPLAIQSQLRVHMPLYTGNNPPDISGVFLMSPAELVFTSDNEFEPGFVFADLVMQFIKQDRYNVYTYRGKHIGAAMHEVSRRATITGSGNNFTLFFKTYGVTTNVRTEKAVVFSGTKTYSGIENIHYSFILLKKGFDLTGKLMNENEFRIITDGDGISENTTWISDIGNDSISDSTMPFEFVAEKNRYE